jgi:hypothetical protein
MSTSITLVVADNVADTGEIDYTFLIYAPDRTPKTRWGALLLSGDEDAPSWSLNVFEDHRGRVVAGTGRQSDDEHDLTGLLRDAAPCAPFALLVSAGDLARIEFAAAAAQVQLAVQFAHRPLATNRNHLQVEPCL